MFITPPIDEPPLILMVIIKRCIFLKFDTYKQRDFYAEQKPLFHPTNIFPHFLSPKKPWNIPTSRINLTKETQRHSCFQRWTSTAKTGFCVDSWDKEMLLTNGEHHRGRDEIQKPSEGPKTSEAKTTRRSRANKWKGELRKKGKRRTWVICVEWKPRGGCQNEQSRIHSSKKKENVPRSLS